MGLGLPNSEGFTAHLTQRHASQFDPDSIRIQCTHPANSSSTTSSARGGSLRTQTEAREGGTFRAANLDSRCEDCGLHAMWPYLWLAQETPSLSPLWPMRLFVLFRSGQ
jgi:hypothetical protein